MRPFPVIRRGTASVCNYKIIARSGLHASFTARGPYVDEYLGGWKSSRDRVLYLLQWGKLQQRLWTQM
jgi:hypothetical protein